MLTAISRYGARVLPEHRGDRRGLQGPRRVHPGSRTSREFEARVRARAARRRRTPSPPSYGRMAFYYMLKALDLPPGSEIIFPALTFWVVPELARVAGLKVVFADVDPTTFTHRSRRRSSALITASDPRRRADASLRAAVRHGRASWRSRRGTTCIVHRGLRARARRDLQGPAGRHVRRRRASSASRR